MKILGSCGRASSMKIEGYNTITIVLQCGEGLSVPFRPSLKSQKERKFIPSSSQNRTKSFKRDYLKYAVCVWAGLKPITVPAVIYFKHYISLNTP